LGTNNSKTWFFDIGLILALNAPYPLVAMGDWATVNLSLKCTDKKQEVDIGFVQK
jgi:hypothetical protein